MSGITPDSPEWPVPGDDSDTASPRFTPALAVVVFVGGGLLGLFGGFLAAVEVTVLGWNAPVGAVLVVATLVATQRALIHLFDARRAAVVFLLGWAVVTVVLALPGPGGDIVIAKTPVALMYLLGGIIVGTAVANVPATLRPRAGS